MVKIHKLSSRLFQTFPSLHLSRSQMKKRKSLGRGKGDNGSDRKRHFFFSIFFFFFLPWTGVSSFCVSMPIHGTELASLSSPVWRGGKEKKVPRSRLLDSAHFDKQASKRDRRKRKRGEGEAEAEEVGGVCGCKRVCFGSVGRLFVLTRFVQVRRCRRRRLRRRRRRRRCRSRRFLFAPSFQRTHIHGLT